MATETISGAPPGSGSERQEQPLFPAARAFVVQVARNADGSELLSGRVEHVISGRSRRFASRDDLVAFVCEVLADLEAAATRAGSGIAGDEVATGRVGSRGALG